MSCKPCRSPMLVLEVQPPHYIYVGGDGRLKLSKQSTNQYNPTFYSQTLVPASVIRRPLQSSSNIDNRARCGPIRPSSANRRRLPPTGSLPRGWGVWFQKRRLIVLRIALQVGLPWGELRSISPGTAGTRGRVRVKIGRASCRERVFRAV